MASVPRNAPCPCGSGLKYKRCCLEREQELQREDEALEELLALPSLFPLLRPLDPRFEAWAASVGDVDPTRELVESGLRLIGRREWKRIVRGAEAMVGALGETRQQAVLVGSTVAALREQRELDPAALDHLESCEGCRSGPAESLAAVLEPWELWSVADAEQADDALDRAPEAEDNDRAFEGVLTLQAGSAWSKAHARRLDLLLRRVRSQLPVAGFSLASTALSGACVAIEREHGVRMRLAGLLLADTLGAARLMRLAA